MPGFSRKFETYFLSRKNLCAKSSTSSRLFPKKILCPRIPKKFKADFFSKKNLCARNSSLFPKKTSGKIFVCQKIQENLGRNFFQKKIMVQGFPKQIGVDVFFQEKFVCQKFQFFPKKFQENFCVPKNTGNFQP